MDDKLWLTFENYRRALTDAAGLPHDTDWDTAIAHIKLRLAAAKWRSSAVQLSDDDIRALGVPLDTQLLIDFESATQAYLWIECRGESGSTPVEIPEGVSEEFAVNCLATTLATVLEWVTKRIVELEAAKPIARRALDNFAARGHVEGRGE